MRLVFEFLKRGWVLTILISFFFLNHFYYDVLFAPNKHTFNPSGDGIKNYYTFAYFIKNNESLTSFEGMNYPYGESIMYTDGHPALAYFLKVLSAVFSSIDTNINGIINLVMLLSIILTAFIFYRIFELLKVQKYFAVFSAVGLAFLAPQAIRLLGHYSLSYSFCIPLTILLLLKIRLQGEKLSFYLGLGCSVLLWFFTHPYLGLMAAGVTALHALLLMVKNGKPEIKQNLKLMACGLVPMFVFLLFSKAIDSHDFRPTNPYGIHEFYATFDSVFLSYRAPFHDLYKLFYEFETTSWEGVSYIGIVSLVVVALFIMRSIKLSFENNRVIFFHNWLEHSDLRLLVVSAIIFVFFSMLLPFRWGFEGVVDHISFLNQFRSIGRFSWVFFHVIGIVVVFVINQFIVYLQQQNKTKWVYALTVGVPFLYLSEGFSVHREVGGKISQADNVFSVKRSSEAIQNAVNAVEPQYYQAIIPVPYYHVGTDNYGKGSSDRSQYLSMVMSFHYGLPLVSSHLARTSLKEARGSFQLFSENYFAKDIVSKLDNQLPFLILYPNGDNLNPNEIGLVNKSKKIHENSEFALYEISYKDLLGNTNEEEKQRFSSKTDLYQVGDFWVSDTNKYFVWHSMDNDAEGSSYCNNGKKAIARDYTVFVDSQNEDLPRNREYEASVWVYVGDSSNYFGQDKFNYSFFLEEKKDGQNNWVKITGPREAMTIDGAWSQLKFRFWAVENAEYKIFIHGDDNSDQEIKIDEFLLRETSLDVYEQRSQKLLKNAHWIR